MVELWKKKADKGLQEVVETANYGARFLVSCKIKNYDPKVDLGSIVAAGVQMAFNTREGTASFVGDANQIKAILACDFVTSAHENTSNAYKQAKQASLRLAY